MACWALGPALFGGFAVIASRIVNPIVAGVAVVLASRIVNPIVAGVAVAVSAQVVLGRRLLKTPCWGGG